MRKNRSTPAAASRTHLSFGLVGLGGIARSVLALWQREGPTGVKCVGVLMRPGRGDVARAVLRGTLPVVERLDHLLQLGCRLLVDCAGHGALRAYGREAIEAGCDILTVSSGAFADPALEASLRDAAQRHGRRIIVPAGALAGIDALAAARHGGLSRVTYSGRKPVQAWQGTAAERLVDLANLGAACVFFEGSAREAARLYPANANVAATVALAGLGFERTEARLIADPAASRNVHEIEFEGSFGRARIEIFGSPSPDNPRTSVLTGLSVWRALLEEAGATIILGLPALLAESAVKPSG